MYLSKIMSNINYAEPYKIENEKGFETLGLVAHNPNIRMCTFIEEKKYVKRLGKDVTVVITKPDLINDVKDAGKDLAMLTTQNPKQLFFMVHNYLSDKEEYKRKQFPMTIGKNSKISSSAVIAKNNVTIGNNVTVEDFVIIRENTVVGDNTIIRSGSIIGGEGFEFKRYDKSIQPIKHCGGVVIGSNVEIQYNVCVDKAVYPWDNTVIDDYCKVDNLVQIGHAAKIGKYTLIAGSAAIAGRTILQENIWVGSGALISNGLHIGKNVDIAIGSVVLKNIDDNSRVFGNPAKIFDTK